MSLKAFGRRHEVSGTAVERAVKAGRLRRSVRRDARGPYIADLELADHEWRTSRTKPTNSGGRRRPRARAGNHNSAPAAAPATPPVQPAPAPDTPPIDGPAAAAAPATPSGPSLVESQVRLAEQRAEALELANRRQRGLLVEAAEVERAQFEIARTLRQRILNVPERLADLPAEVRRRMLDELRAALGGLADELERG